MLWQILVGNTEVKYTDGMISATKDYVVIITTSPHMPGVLQLCRAAQELGVVTQICSIHDVAATTVSTINKARSVICRVSPKTVDLYASLAERVGSSAQEVIHDVLQAFDKAATAKLLAAHAIATPATHVITRSESPSEYPCVIKVLHGNQGVGVELLRNEQHFREFVSAYPLEQHFLVQEFIAEARGRDKRLFVVQGQVVAAMERISTTDDFRANLHTGASARAYTPNDEEVRIAIQATRIFGLTFAGVDIIDSKRKPLVLEVNPSPGFAISKITGVDVATEVIKGVVGTW